MKVCIHCFISGKVQDVWFRANTKIQADDLAVTGWVRNLPDGRVEVLACGEEAQINKLKAWLKHGPPLARVDELTCEQQPWEEHERFEVV